MAGSWKWLEDYADSGNQTGQVWLKRTGDGATLRLTEHNDEGLTYRYSLSVIRSEGEGFVLMAPRTEQHATSCYGFAETWSEVNGLESWYDEVVRLIRESGSGASMCGQHQKFACSEMYHAREVLNGDEGMDGCDACLWVERDLPMEKRGALA